MLRITFLSFFVLVGSLAVQAQTDGKEASNSGNGFLSNLIGGFSLHDSTGFGATFYSHKIEGPGILQQKDGEVFLFDNFFVIGDTLNPGYAGWVNNAQATGGILIGDEDFLLSTDTTEVKYSGTGGSIPISATLSYTYDDIDLVVELAMSFLLILNIILM